MREDWPPHVLQRIRGHEYANRGIILGHGHGHLDLEQSGAISSV